MGVELVVLLMLIGAFTAGFLNLQKRVGTRVARQRAFRVVPLIILTVAVIVIVQKDGATSAVTSELVRTYLPLALSGLEWFALLTWPIRKQRAGRVLDDLGPHPARRAMWLLGLSAALTTTASLINAIESNTLGWRTLVDESFFLSSAIAALVVARSRVQITERGFLRFDLQFNWDQIESWRFESGGTIDRLLLRVRTWIPWGRSPALEVEPSVRPLLENWLIERAPASGRGTGLSTADRS